MMNDCVLPDMNCIESQDMLMLLVLSSGWGISAVFSVEGMDSEMRVLTDCSELSAGAQGVDGK